MGCKDTKIYRTNLNKAIKEASCPGIAGSGWASAPKQATQHVLPRRSCDTVILMKCYLNVTENVRIQRHRNAYSLNLKR